MLGPGLFQFLLDLFKDPAHSPLAPPDEAGNLLQLVAL
jgi:hypothetical protein